MNTTAQHTLPLDSSYENTPVPILMRLPDLRLVESEEIKPAASQPAMEPVPEPIATKTSTPEPSEPEESTLAALVTMVEHEIEQASRPADDEPSEPAAAAVVPENKPTELPPAATVAPPITRRDRAQERLRRQQVEPAPKSWWRSHAPTILIGFVIALGVTLYVAKQKREQDRPAPETWVNDATPELNIEMNEAPATLPVIEKSAETQVAAEIKPPAASAMTDAIPKPEKKSPPLLSADPATEPAANESTAPVAEATTPAVEPKTEVTSTPANTGGYPVTDPGEYRPGGRVALLPEKTGADSSAADVPSYPVTNYPSTWR